MAPSAATTYLYCVAADVENILSVDGDTGRLDDDDSGSLSATESGYLTRAIQWATARVNLYLLGKYPAVDLAQSWIVNQYASIVAAYLVCSRRGNSAPASLKALYEETMEDLKQLRAGEIQLPDTAMRTAAWPAWSNVNVSVLYTIKRVRVQKPISESRGGDPDYQQATDRAAEFIGPYENQ